MTSPSPTEQIKKMGQCEWHVADNDDLFGIDSRVYIHLICRRHGEFKRIKIEEDTHD
jgi:hypothetical protein